MTTYYEALPICKAAMDVAVLVDAVVQRLAKGHKYTLGARLRETAFDIVVLFARCNRRAERARELPLLCDRIEETLEEPESCGNVKRRRLAYIFKRPVTYESEQDKSQ
jgi:hypothetical protein